MHVFAVIQHIAHTLSLGLAPDSGVDAWITAGVFFGAALAGACAVIALSIDWVKGHLR